MSPTVTITENGRDGHVDYAEGVLRTISGYWEFGGNDVVVIVSMGSLVDWQRSHSWAVERRASILRFIADEVVRQRAPTSVARIDVERGEILLRKSGTSAPGEGPRTAQVQAATFVHRYSKLKMMLGIGVLIAALIGGALFWFGKQALTVAPASGVPLGECVRTEHHIASLIQTTDPHLPNWSGRGGNETTSISILLIPLDGSTPRLIPVVGGRSGQSYSLARIFGSDGRTIWFDATGLYGVRLSDYEFITPKHLRETNTALDPKWWEDTRSMDIEDGKLHIMNDDRSAAVDMDPATWKATIVAPRPSNARFERHEPTDHLAAGLITSSGDWFGLYSAAEMTSDLEVNSWIRRVESAEDAKQLRRFFSAELEASSEGDHFRILKRAPMGTVEYLNAAFLRMDDASEPLRLRDPESALMIHTDKPGLGGELIVSRVDMTGKLLWSTETGLDRYYVSQILPGIEAFAFVGTRPPVEGKLSEPLVVVVENATGKLRSHSLWR